MSEGVVIIGNGIAGITAARHIRKQSDVPIRVISSETKHFYSRTALMYIFMGHMKYEHTKPYEDWFWEKNNIELIFDYVDKVDFGNKALQLKTGSPIQYESLIIATGSRSNKFGWPGQDLEGVQGLYNYQDLELMEKNTLGIQRAVVVGGGLIGVEMAEMLRSRDIEVTFLVRENQFWDNVLPQQEASLISRHIREHHVDLKLATELREIQGDENGRVKAVVTGNGEVIECQFVGLTAGVSPNIEFLRNSEIEINRGIQVNEFLETNIPNVYAIGDCCELKSPPVNRRSMEPVWYTGRIMGETVAQTITGTRTAYDPGNWFNSAKFFDIEYQTYGTVDRELKQGQEEFFWVYKCGRKCMHFIFESKSRKLIGVNSFGIRLRQEVFDRWLNEGKRIDEVINNLKKANFDPEFYKRYEREIKEIFFNEFPEMAEELKEGKSVFNTIER